MAFESSSAHSPRQISPFQRTKSFSASSATSRHIAITPPPKQTVISTQASGDLAVSHRSSFNPKLLLVGRDSMDGAVAPDKARGRSSSILQTWFGAGDGLNEVEQAELEIEKMISKIRRDLNHMHDQDLYFSKWIGTLGRKISDLESVVYSSSGGQHPAGRRDSSDDEDDDDDDELDTGRCCVAPYSNGNLREANGRCVPSPLSYSVAGDYKALSRSESQVSAATSNSSGSTTSSCDGTVDSDYGTDHKLAPIRERHPSSPLSPDSLMSPPPPPVTAVVKASAAPVAVTRVTSCDSVDSLYARSYGSGGGGGSGGPLRRQGSDASGIHADELLAMYSKREKGVRQEMGLASHASTPSKQTLLELCSPRNSSLVNECSDEDEDEDLFVRDSVAAAASSNDVTPQLSPNSCSVVVPDRSSSSSSQPGSNSHPDVTDGAWSSHLDGGTATRKSSDTPTPALLYNEIFEPPPSALEALSPMSPPPEDDQFLTPRLAKRNSGIFGSVRLRQSLRNITRGKIQQSSSPAPEKPAEKAAPATAVASDTPSSSPFARTEKTRWRWGSVRGSSAA